MTPISFRAFAALVIASALAVASCSSSSSSPNAAEAKGVVTITRDQLDEELDVIRDNEEFRAMLEESYGVSLEGDAKGTDNTAFVAQVLTYDLYYAQIDKSMKDQGIEITEAVVAEAEDRLASDPGEEIMNSLPDSYREELVRREAMLLALIDHTGAPYEPATSEEYFAAHPEEFETLCFSHVLVAPESADEEEAKARADDLYQQIESGTSDFATLATTQSDDSTAAEQNGEVGCYTLAGGEIDADFMEAALAATLGEVTEPVRTQFGYHLILVTSRTPAADYAAAENDVSTRLDDLSRQAYNEALFDAICGVEVTVNERYGTWDDSACQATGSDKGLALVVPPEGTAASTTTTAG